MLTCNNLLIGMLFVYNSRRLYQFGQGLMYKSPNGFFKGINPTRFYVVQGVPKHIIIFDAKLAVTYHNTSPR